MPRVLTLFPAALEANRRGISQNAFIREQQAAGTAGRFSEMRNLFNIAKSVVVAQPSEPFANPEEAPRISDLAPWPTKKATGVRQNVTLTYRDRTTGQIKQTFWSTVGTNPLTREQAAAMAIDAYSEHAESYEQDLIGAVHTSAYNLTPFEGE